MTQKNFLGLVVQFDRIPVGDRTNFREQPYANQMLE